MQEMVHSLQHLQSRSGGPDAGQDHREQLRAYVIKHYDGPHARSKTIYPSLPPDDLEFARRRAAYQGWSTPAALRSGR